MLKKKCLFSPTSEDLRSEIHDTFSKSTRLIGMYERVSFSLSRVFHARKFSTI